jgi:Methyltransferase domain
MHEQPRDGLFDHVSNYPGLEQYYHRTEGMISFAEFELLYNLAKKVAAGTCIVEVGSYRGRSAVALGRGSLDGSKVPVYAIEPHEQSTGVLRGSQYGPADRGAFYKAMLDTSCYHVVRLVNLRSEFVVLKWAEKVSLLWIDAHHTYEAVKSDFDCWAHHLAPNAIIAFDDSSQKGPATLIQELMNDGFRRISKVGKVTVLGRELGPA